LIAGCLFTNVWPTKADEAAKSCDAGVTAPCRADTAVEVVVVIATGFTGFTAFTGVADIGVADIGVAMGTVDRAVDTGVDPSVLVTAIGTGASIFTATATGFAGVTDVAEFVDDATTGAKADTAPGATAAAGC